MRWSHGQEQEPLIVCVYIVMINGDVMTRRPSPRTKTRSRAIYHRADLATLGGDQAAASTPAQNENARYRLQGSGSSVREQLRSRLCSRKTHTCRTPTSRADLISELATVIGCAEVNLSSDAVLGELLGKLDNSAGKAHLEAIAQIKAERARVDGKLACAKQVQAALLATYDRQAHVTLQAQLQFDSLYKLQGLQQQQQILAGSMACMQALADMHVSFTGFSRRMATGESHFAVAELLAMQRYLESVCGPARGESRLVVQAKACVAASERQLKEEMLLSWDELALRAGQQQQPCSQNVLLQSQDVSLRSGSCCMRWAGWASWMSASSGWGSVCWRSCFGRSCLHWVRRSSVSHRT